LNSHYIFDYNPFDNISTKFIVNAKLM